ncbi:hypothetical protein LguiA_006824 [Lonicera macranthoides]
MSLKFGCKPTLVVSSAQMAREVMKTHDLAFCSRPALVGQQKLSYQGLDVAFSPYNDNWRMLRKICTLHLFNLNSSQSFRPIHEDEVSQMIAKIIEVSVSSKLVNLSEVTMTLAGNIICRVAFGKRYDEGYERSRFRGLLMETQLMFLSFFVSDYFPSIGWVDKLTGLWARLEKNFKDMDLFYQELIDEHLDPMRPKSKQKDIIDILLQLRKEEQSSFEITFDHIKAVVMNLLVGATDTSAVVLVWAMVCLMKEPLAMKKVQEEVRKSVGRNKGTVNEDDLEKLPYLKAVVKETMRLYPPAPLLVPHENTESCVINGYEIGPKTLVFVNVWSIGRDPECWEKPEEFFPERFLNSTIDYKGQDFEFIPFGAGRRGCPGMDMGAKTVEIALANLLYSFDWELPAGTNKEDIETDSNPGLAMHKKNALFLRAKPYNSNLDRGRSF